MAVGFGLNIQAANHVIHFSRTWNPAKEDQATDRAYRIGQERDVYVYYPTIHADDFTTFDVQLDRLLTAKRSLADDMLNGAGWWNAPPEQDRRYWMRLAGDTGRAVDAWRAFKRARPALGLSRRLSERELDPKDVLADLFEEMLLDNPAAIAE